MLLYQSFLTSTTKDRQTVPYRKIGRKCEKIDVIPRVRIFLWKAYNNALPTRTNLKKRRSDVDPTCMLCGADNETTKHLLLHCLTIFPLWHGSMLRLDTRREMDNKL